MVCLALVVDLGCFIADGGWWCLPAGCASVPQARGFASAIDGEDSRSWHLPLPPLDGTSLEPYSPGAPLIKALHGGTADGKLHGCPRMKHNW